MSGKVIGVLVVAIAAIAGVAMYILQVFAFYDEVALDRIELTSVATGAPDLILTEDIRAIDATSSPLRFRACFKTEHSHAMLTEEFVVYEKPVPLVAPGWFDCFDAAKIGKALEEERAIAFLGQREIADGVDRVIAVFDDGRAFAWHQLNEKYQD